MDRDVIRELIINNLYKSSDDNPAQPTDNFIDSIPEFANVNRHEITEVINDLFNKGIIKGRSDTNETYPSIIYLSR